MIEARLTHLAYAPEIAGAMLQCQQASAILAARQKIVEGPVQMAAADLSRSGIMEVQRAGRGKRIRKRGEAPDANGTVDGETDPAK